METIEEYKQRMRTASAHGMTGDEKDIVDELLANSPNELDTFLEWIFVEHKGDVAARAKAGLKLLERNPEKSKQAVERLLDSDDPDDQSTAIQVLEYSPNRTEHNVQASEINQGQEHLHKVPPIIRDVAISLFALSLPPVIWMFITQRFTIESFIKSVVWLIQFSTLLVAMLLPFRIPPQSQENGTIYLLNLLPLVLLGVPTFLMSWKRFGVKKAIRATWITIAGIAFLMELAALVVMYFFSHGGPF
jgi:hypothetical protein